MKTENQLDDLVQSVALYKHLKVIFHGYVLPFIILYFGWMYFWLTCYDFQEFYEAGAIGFTIIGCLQIFCCLFCHWSVHFQCFMTCRAEPDPIKATVALVVPTSNNGSSELVRLHHSSSTNTLNNSSEKPVEQQTIWFNFQKTKYLWDWNRKTFGGLQYPVVGTFGEYLAKKGYQEEADVAAAEEMYGKNDMEMVVPEFGELFKERATAPFFVFQVFCVALWCLDKYWYYSLFTLVMLVLFECTLVQQQLRNMAEIRKMGNRPYTVLVYRGRRWRPVPSNRLLPGDIVSIGRAGQQDNLVPCDMMLLRGPCIVDESMLTGESVPQMKEPVECREEGDVFEMDTDGRLHVLFGGTRVVQHTPPGKGAVAGSGAPARSTDNGCIAVVLRTGFSTSQGKLLRTILFGVKRVTANNRETFAFILFLLVFAVAAAGYVWRKGVEDPTRSRYRLMLECALILTSVVPPELPIELSLAVNTSLLALAKLGVYCTEPFRIPFAGKVDVCCFDKTGTLTSDHLVVEGVALITTPTSPDKPTVVTPSTELPPDTIQVLATCHSLVQLDDGLVGDPLEKATLAAVDWTLTRGDAVIPRKGKMPAMKIFHRYHFTSQLKRMSVIAGHSAPGTNTDTVYVAGVKGAPETLRGMFRTVPAGYDAAYLELSRRGARVLALGRKDLGVCSPQEVRAMTRDEIERDLTFVGLVVISCPLKPDSLSVVREIVHASHRVVMITGDGPLTACHVARELAFLARPASNVLLTVYDAPKDQWLWQSVDQTTEYTVKECGADTLLCGKYELCITGDGMEHLLLTNITLLYKLLPRVAVFARFAPKQKEYVINCLKALGHTTLMCGDGTNDVGALKHADVGVAILSSPAPSVGGGREAIKERESSTGAEQGSEELNSSSISKDRRRMKPGPRAELRARRAGTSLANNASPNPAADKLKNLIKELEEADTATLIRLGDASIASPFTSKLSSVQCICHVIKQGRCTLVTTLQMFKILALNALVLAYTQSVLYLDGIKLRDAQATLQGLLLAACFLFISRSKPLKTLSQQRPLPNIFNLYTILTVLLQFGVHFGALVYLVSEAKARTPAAELEAAAAAAAAALTADPPPDDAEDTFTPNIVNSAVYIISMALQVATFAINYRGRPYMESLVQNKALLYSVLCSGGAVLALAMGLVPDLAAQFEIIDFPPDFRNILVAVLFADFFFSYLVDRVCLWLCGEGKLKIH